jgi:DNA-binding winged helix-turn-helix (wHTH) protein/serine/threonine protein kinase
MKARPDATTDQGTERVRRRWRFGNAVLDERSLELHVDGRDVELERKPLEVLLYLIGHAGEVCTKDELLSEVWPGRVLSETVLTKCIGRLRDALGDVDQEIIKTSYGFGYRFAAPVQVDADVLAEPPRFDFKPGDHLPARPHWVLFEKLGVGSHGEAWRMRHDKTGEERVFKFALDEVSLSALKREITLFRVVNDSLGDTACVVRLLDWNLEQPPYFVESEYAAGGSLDDWVKSRGGIAAVPMNERIEVVARIATTLASVHAVGVLHKDLKPGNVLVRPKSDGSADVLLADFGSGGVLDLKYIERLGITRLGFTRTVATDINFGTPMYLAPEIIAGQTFTVKSDIYALGVILYQFVAGDFHRVISAGWERQVDDELVREDIALLLEGNPAIRLADADVLARRLRSLESRREERAAERAAAATAERGARLLERARARRAGLVLAFIVLAAGLATSSFLYVQAHQAQKLATAAAQRSSTVVEFLGNNVFAPVSSGNESTKDLSVLDLLTRAGGEIDKKFAEQPDIASQLHFVLGRSFESMYESPAAVNHLNRALELGEHLDGEGSESALRAVSELVYLDYVVGRLGNTLPRYQSALASGRQRLPKESMPLLELRLRLARGSFLLGQWRRASQDLTALLDETRTLAVASAEFRGRVEFHQGQVLTDLVAPNDAQVHLREAIRLLTQALGEHHEMVAEARAAYGRALGNAGHIADADAELVAAETIATRWAPPGTWAAVRPKYFRALLLLDQGDPAHAEPILASIVDYEDTNKAAYLAAHKDEGEELDHTGPVRQALGEALSLQGKTDAALEILRRAVAVSERADGSMHPSVVSARLSLAECLLSVPGSEGEAQKLLDQSPTERLELPPGHPIVAQRDRVAGLLARWRHDEDAARDFLTQSLRIYESTLGARHWRVIRARRELLTASN